MRFSRFCRGGRKSKTSHRLRDLESTNGTFFEDERVPRGGVENISPNSASAGRNPCEGLPKLAVERGA